ncbi:MAG: Zn-ribbon domain-containing OB-fold protein [Candidatus Dormibacteraeota bacterium]|nr:Zn-ribbon domain-containing OB-fold protein [Candidatus Dormibacteraeota bacterium]
MKIVPELTDLTRPYWEAAREGRLVVQRCGACGRLRHPPLHRCPHCHATEVEWTPVEGRGTVYTFTVVEHPTHAALKEAVPYVVALVELAEGPRILTNIRGCPPESVRVGMPVRVTFEKVDEVTTLPQFIPA